MFLTRRLKVRNVYLCFFSVRPNLLPGNRNVWGRTYLIVNIGGIPPGQSNPGLEEAHIKMTGVLVGNFRKHPKRYLVSFYRRGSETFLPLRGTIIFFRLNILKGTAIILTVVILAFSTLSGTPSFSYGRLPPPPTPHPGVVSQGRFPTKTAWIDSYNLNIQG